MSQLNNTQSALEPKCEEVCEHCRHRHANPICSVEHLIPNLQTIKKSIHLNSGDFLFRMGDAAAGIYSLRSGVIKLESYSKSGATHTPRIYGPGSAFGYRSLFSQKPMSTSAVAMEDCELCILPKDQVLALVSKDPEVLLLLVKQLSEDLSVSEQKWNHQIDLGSEERIAEALLFLFDRFPNTPWTRKDIAQWAGTTPETVIRTLAKFEKQGLIDQSQGRQIKVLNRPNLVQVFNGED